MNVPRKPLRHHLHDYFFPHERNNYRPHLFSIVSVTVLVLAVIVFEAGYLVQTRIVFLKTNFLASVLPGSLIALTNQDRAASGLTSVTEDSLLDTAAAAAAADMAEKGYFAHVSPDGKDPWYWLDSVGYKYSYAGENLAVNFSDSSNVEVAWMNSPTHRANIEKPQYTKVGIGVANGVYEGKETTFVVQFFATPAASVAASPVAVAKAAPEEVTPPQNPEVGASSNVLGTEVVPTPKTPVSTDWLNSLLASPFTTLETILTILLAIIAVSGIVVLFARGKNHHPSVRIGSIILFICILAALFFSALVAGPVLIPTDTQATNATGTSPI